MEFFSVLLSVFHPGSNLDAPPERTKLRQALPSFAAEEKRLAPHSALTHETLTFSALVNNQMAR